MIEFFYFLLDFGDLLFMRRWYSSCACLDKLGGASAIDTSIMATRLHNFSVYREYHKENRLVYQTKVSQPIRP